MSLLFEGGKKSYDEILREFREADAAKETLEMVVAEMRQLEADPQVRLADEEQELMDCLREIRDGLRKKKARGRQLEAQGVTMELIRRYRKDYAETNDWGC